ncbi:thiamine-phosphate kinase [Mucilaginibacter sp. KACC 22773]|uniref:thiamine-phosphate kinase n=1 Tax=Mucilaginibacter sp. KACC 22773 TaxID=3025671 RepID=UPI002366721D|nr:thiamine-phosphate kinase [Mucilaginibacter sp. KACC 22773]WDF77335.1 thiamine-phosphate kinase [Mucilaginibacter sp. KACC 22773]
MKLSELGERQIIQSIIKEKFFKNLALDDCAIFGSQEEQFVISVDQAFNNPFVLKIGGSLKELGQLFVTQNASDIAAMGCDPIGFLFAVSLPKDLEVEKFEELLSGIKEELEYYHISLLGGDTKEAEKIYLSGTILGKSKGRILTRNGAQIGDIICLSKPVGNAFAKYIDYANGKSSSIFTPKADIELGRGLSYSNLCSSCIDTSDGVFASLQLLSEVNKLTFNVDLNKIEYVFPIGFDEDLDWVNYILNIGGDFGLLFTLMDCEESEQLIDRFNILKIGHVSGLDQKIVMTGNYAKSSSILPWEHFSNIDFFKSNFDKFIKK